MTEQHLPFIPHMPLQHLVAVDVFSLGVLTGTFFAYLPAIASFVATLLVIFVNAIVLYDHIKFRRKP